MEEEEGEGAGIDDTVPAPVAGMEEVEGLGDDNAAAPTDDAMPVAEEEEGGGGGAVVVGIEGARAALAELSGSHFDADVKVGCGVVGASMYIYVCMHGRTDGRLCRPPPSFSH